MHSASSAQGRKEQGKPQAHSGRISLELTASLKPSNRPSTLKFCTQPISDPPAARGPFNESSSLCTATALATTPTPPTNRCVVTSRNRLLPKLIRSSFRCPSTVSLALTESITTSTWCQRPSLTTTPSVVNATAPLPLFTRSFRRPLTISTAMKSESTSVPEL